MAKVAARSVAGVGGAFQPPLHRHGRHRRSPAASAAAGGRRGLPPPARKVEPQFRRRRQTRQANAPRRIGDQPGIAARGEHHHHRVGQPPARAAAPAPAAGSSAAPVAAYSPRATDMQHQLADHVVGERPPKAGMTPPRPLPERLVKRCPVAAIEPDMVSQVGRAELLVASRVLAMAGGAGLGEDLRGALGRRTRRAPGRSSVRSHVDQVEHLVPLQHASARRRRASGCCASPLGRASGCRRAACARSPPAAAPEPVAIGEVREAARALAVAAVAGRAVLPEQRRARRRRRRRGAPGRPRSPPSSRRRSASRWPARRVSAASTAAAGRRGSSSRARPWCAPPNQGQAG